MLLSDKQAKSRSGILRRYIEKNILGMEVRDYEKSSYGGYAYRRVQRLRKRGEKRGIFVPALEYELTKPDKRRTAFWITAIWHRYHGGAVAAV